MIVDAHTHWDSARPTTSVDWMKTLDRHGVTHALVMPTQALFDSAVIPKDNDDTSDACDSFPQRMLPCCTINPWKSADAIEEFQRCIKKHHIRGLKIHPWLQGCSPNWPQMDDICEVAAEHDVPVLFHDGTPCFSLPSQIALLAKRHPKTNIVLGHCGLFEHWQEAILALNSVENLWGCLCGPHWEGLCAITHNCDTSRLLWGSDYGFGTTDVVGNRLQIIYELGLDEHTLNAIFSDNPSRLFKLDYC